MIVNSSRCFAFLLIVQGNYFTENLLFYRKEWTSIPVDFVYLFVCLFVDTISNIPVKAPAQ